MKLIHTSTETDLSRGCAVAVGSFDGVHIGHREMLSLLVAEAKKEGIPAVIFTFDSADSPKNGAKLLALPEKKAELLDMLGIDAVFTAAFSEFRNMPPVEFAEGLLYGTLNAKVVVCGYDFRFGMNRSGDVALIDKSLSPKGVRVVTASAVVDNGTPVSSTLVRGLIANGDVKSANRLLGRGFSFSASVESGARLGRELGFPTINQALPQGLVIPKLGVYAVICRLDGREYEAVANVGCKPTVSDEKIIGCESFMFGFSGDCYGKCVETEFVEFIRGEQRFDSVALLKAQVERDIETAKKIFSKE